jgi:LuxR family maltose regulon positive regulatory protein
MSSILVALRAQDPAPDERSVDAFFLSGLSNRELDVLLLLGERLTNKEIAERLYISPITVKTHTANIYRKLKVNSRRQAVARALQLGLLPSHRT